MKKSLNEELKRHMQIVNYANDLDKVIEEKFKVTFQEQEPETEPEEDVEGDTEETPTTAPRGQPPKVDPSDPGVNTPMTSSLPATKKVQEDSAEYGRSDTKEE